MQKRAVVGLCRTLAVLTVGLSAVLNLRAAAEERLYPHAERVSGPWGYIDKSGRVVLPLQFDWAEPFSEGRAAVVLNKKYGYIDSTGRLVIALQFDVNQSVEPPSFQSGRAVVKDGNQMRLIDRDGSTIAIDRAGAVVTPRRYVMVQPELSGYRQLSDGDRIIVFSGGKYGKNGAIDPSGRTIIEPEYKHMEPFSEGLAAVSQGGKVGFIDRDGKLVVPFELDGYSTYFRDGRAKATEKLSQSEPKRDKNGKVVAHTDFRCGFVDRSGTLVIPRVYDDCQDFHEGRAAVWVAAQGWGIIDLEGRFVVSPQFTGAHGSPSFPRKFWQAGSGSGSVSGPERPGFSEGLMAVSNEDGYGYIDRDGKLVIGHRFRAASLFHDGLAVVVMPAEVGLGIQQGTLNLTNPSEGYFTGVIDRSGRFVAPPVYDWAKVHPGGLVQVKFGDRIGYLDATGKPLTFSANEIEEHVGRKREQLKPPPPGRAVVGKAGDTSYYLHLPDGICAFDPGVPQDRKFLEDLQSKAAAEMEAAKQKVPQLTEESWRDLKKETGEFQTGEFLKANSGLLTRCDQLDAMRSGGNEKALRTFAIASGMQKDRYDPSGNSGLVYMAALMCKLADKDSIGAPRPKDNSARVWNAFKRLESGESTSLPALAYEGFACYSARVAPATEDAGVPPQAPAKTKVRFHSLLVLPNWMLQIFAEESIAASPDALYRELDRQKALVGAFEDANLKKPTPSTRP